MRSFLLLAAVALASGTSALNLAQHSTAPVVSAPIHRRESKYPPHVRDRLRRRASAQPVSLDNEYTLYFANVSIGTPPQAFRLHLDTGSSDLWVNSATSDLCESTENACTNTGTYSANASSTYHYVNSEFNISYVDGSGAAGDYATDTMSIGDVTLTNFQFGIGYTSSSAEGILGIGYYTNEVSLLYAGGATYPNLPVALVNAGIINSPAYSLWLNDLDASTGTILFGGIDTAKYHGVLASVPILSQGKTYRELVVGLTALGANGNPGAFASDQRISALLDSGSSLTYLPNTLTNQIYSKYNAQYDTRQGAALVDCSLAESTDTIDFTFSSPTISVAMSEMVLSAGGAVCVLGIAPSNSNTAVLGDTFLRSAYVVYDLANNRISLAQTNFNTTSTSVELIGTGSDAVPNASIVQNAVATATGGRYSGGVSAGNTSGASTARVSLAFIGAMAAALGMGAAMIVL